MPNESATPRRREARRADARGGSGRLTPRAEVDGPIPPAVQLAHEVVDRADVGVELGRADADEAHEMRVAAAVGTVAVAPDELLHARVLALLAAAVERLDRDHALERRSGLVVRAEADRRAPRM